jgi:hypothetical protein
LLARLDRQLAAENDLRARMTAAYKPIAARVRSVVDQGAVNRVYGYEKTLFDFDSKYITQPGNLKAIEYLEKTYRSFGYTPEIQWFTPPALQASGGKTGNVVATLKGTVNPELVYVVSSHFDSVAVGPGADDDTSGTAALLETARMLSKTPMPATIVFASFTGEEAGLLGSREFVRLATQNKWQIAGALNNDMIGWAADSSQINNTIRYSNPGIRDIQHGASFLFTDLVLFDAKYYKSTDAAAFYDGWGDIVGGIGSYPILANPNYHQPTDFIETMNFKQILETAKVTAATLMYLASSPARLELPKVKRTGAGCRAQLDAQPREGRHALHRRLRAGERSDADTTVSGGAECRDCERPRGHANRGEGGERRRARRLGLGADHREVGPGAHRHDIRWRSTICRSIVHPSRRHRGVCAKRRASTARWLIVGAGLGGGWLHARAVVVEPGPTANRHSRARHHERSEPGGARPKPQPLVLPPLATSDDAIRELVRELSRDPLLARLLATRELVRNMTLAVVQIGDGRTPAASLATLRPVDSARRPAPATKVEPRISSDGNRRCALCSPSPPGTQPRST